MIVTDKEYSIDKVLVHKFNLMIKRMEGTDDNVVLVDGDEGQGKTEFTVGMCYYVSHETGRKYSVDNIFFDLDEGIEFAANSEEKIIHFDEGALGLLSTQWWNKNQQKFLQLVMMARKKKHFIVICIPKFYKLNQYLVEERTIALIHVYSRKNLQKGRFFYYTKDAKEKLYNDWRRKKIKTYKKNQKFRGSFVKVMEKVFTPEQVEEYEKKKDKAIQSIAQPENKKKELTERDIRVQLLKELRKHLPEITLKQWSKPFGVAERTLNRYISTETGDIKV